MTEVFEPWKIVIDQIYISAYSRGIAPSVSARSQVLFNGQVLKHRPSLHNLDDAQSDHIFGVHPVYSLPVKLNAAVGNLAFLRVEQPGNRLQCGCLTGAIGAKQAYDLPIWHLQGHPLQYQDDIEINNLNIVQP
ncbi:hypothetical protein ES703_119050 [subsurface metagenome]